MKAAVCREFGKPLSLEKIRIDDPHDNEVRIKILACGICHSDVHYIDGAWGGERPAIFGHEAAGVVESCGAKVNNVNEHDTVLVSLLRSCGKCYFCKLKQWNLCNHSFSTDIPGRLQSEFGKNVKRGLGTACFAEYAIVHQSQVVKVEDSTNLISAALLTCGVITGFGSVVNTANVKANSHLAVIGIGGVGINCIQAAKLCNAASIVAIDVNNDKLNLAKQLGATHVVNPTNQSPLQTIMQLTESRGADFVFVATGNPSATTSAFTYIRRGGALVLVGMPEAGTKFTFESLDFIDSNQSILGCKMGSSDLQQDIPKLLNLYSEGLLDLDTLVSATFPFDQINDAIDATRNGIGLRNVVLFD